MKNVKRSADVSGSGRRFCLFEFNYAGCEQSRSEMERWTRTTQRTRNESCVRLGKRTPFLRGRVQLQGCEGERSGLNHWTDMTQRTLKKSCKILHSVKDLGVGIGNDIE